MADEAGNSQQVAAVLPAEGSDSLTTAQEEKTQCIVDACNTKDLDGLISLATTAEGFLTDELRQRACMLQMKPPPTSWLH